MFKERKDIPRDLLVEGSEFLGEALIISHIWETKIHPDPTASQFREIKNLLNKSKYSAVFYDYSCLFQSHKTEDETRNFRDCLGSMADLYAGKLCKSTIHGLYHNASIFQRGWPLFEAFQALSHSRGNFQHKPSSITLLDGVKKLKELLKHDQMFIQKNTIRPTPTSMNEFLVFKSRPNLFYLVLKRHVLLIGLTKLHENQFNICYKEIEDLLLGLNRIFLPEFQVLKVLILRNFIQSTPKMMAEINEQFVLNHSELLKFFDDNPDLHIHQMIVDLNFSNFTNHTDKDEIISQFLK
jgi:hypothetical protein